MSNATLLEPPSDGNYVNQTSIKIGKSEGKKSFKFLRNLSYQKAVTLKEKECHPVPFYLSGTRGGSPLAGEKDEDDKNQECYSSPSSIRTEGSYCLENSTSLLLTSTPNDSPLNSNIHRSVSFSDRLLESTKTESPIELRKKSNSVENSSKDSNSETLMSSTVAIRGLLSTPARMQTLTKEGSVESDAFNTSPGRDPAGRRAIKNMTSNLAKRLSFRKRKIEAKSSSESVLGSQLTNGLPSTEDGVVSYEGLVRLFDCPGCHTLMVPPLIQCRKGHLVCAKCRVTFKGTCPICKQRITETRNYMMEQVCQLVKFSCQFGKYGCPEYHPPKQKADHEHFCVYRPVDCHYAALGCDFVLSLKDMNAHITLCQYRLKGKGPRI